MNPLLISLVVLTVDQLSKLFITKLFQPGESIPVIERGIYLTYIRNTGGAFGLFPNATLFFVIISVLAIISIIIYTLIIPDRSSKKIPLGMILGGALGNLIDRLRFGYVVDFLDLRIWPVFNLGDSAITVGILTLLAQTVIRKRQSWGV